MARKNLFNLILDWLARLFGGQPAPEPPVPEPDFKRTLRTCLIIFDPLLENQGDQRLSQALRWNDPDRLVDELIADLREASHGYADYTITERILVDEFPLKADGFRYSAGEYLRVARERRGMHQPDAVDYAQILADHDLVGKVSRGEIDEVWTVSFPWAGFYESRMAGPGAFWCNAPPLTGSEQAGRRFVIMAFNFERGVGEMLESFGHRAESILAQVFRNTAPEANLWERFTRYDQRSPGQAEAGSIHFAPNSRQDYEWGSPDPVASRWRNWRSFPDLSGDPQPSTCADWGEGDIRAHHKWWFSLMPHISGHDQRIANNWWAYIVDPNEVQ